MITTEIQIIFSIIQISDIDFYWFTALTLNFINPEDEPHNIFCIFFFENKRIQTNSKIFLNFNHLIRLVIII